MVWLLAFNFAGRTWYLSSVECSPELADGSFLAHLPTITDASFTEALNLGGGLSGPCSAALTFMLALEPDREIWRMVLDGYQLAQALGEVSIWTPGTLYEARTILVRGPFIPQSIPTPGLPLVGDFQDLIAVSVADWPPASATVTATTWPNAPATDDTNTEGAPYPFPFGKPGTFTSADGAFRYSIAATECLLVDTTATAQVGVVAGAPIAATTVHIITSGTPYGGDDFPVTTAPDGLGRQVATVDLSTKDGVWTLDGTVKMYVTSYGDGGIFKPTSPGIVLGLGDACLTLLLRRYAENGPERVDVGTWQALAPILNGWRTSFVITERGDPMTVVKTLLDACPALWIVGGPRGLRPVFLADRPAEQRVTLTEGLGIHWIEDSITVGDVKICNDCTASFALQASSGEYRGTATIDATTSPTAAASQSRPWGQRSDTLTVPTYDRGTAGLAAREVVRMRWTQPILLDYESPIEIGTSLDLGQPVLLTDPDRGLNSRALWCVGREYPYDLTVVRLTFAGWW